MNNNNITTKAVTWFALVLIVIAVVLVLASLPHADYAPLRSPCKPIDRHSLSLDAEHREAEPDFIAKAERLNVSGLCVIEGSFGKDYGKFYFVIRGRQGAEHPAERADYTVRYTREELRK